MCGGTGGLEGSKDAPQSDVPTSKQFMEELASAARSPGKVYFTGGATALLLGFREQTIDIDLKLDPEPAGAFEAIAALKNRLGR